MAATNNSANQLTPSYVLGVQLGAHNAVHLLNDGSLVYVAASAIVVYNPETRTQRIFNVTEGTITATALSPGETNLAIAVQHSASGSADGAEKAMVLIVPLHTLRRRKSLTAAHIDARLFDHLAFSNDGRLLVVHSAEPEQALHLFQWEKSLVVAQCKSGFPAGTAVTSLAINPFDLVTLQISLIGGGITRFARFADGALRVTNQVRTDKTLTCQTWVDDQRLVLGSREGTLVVLENAEVVLKINYTTDPRTEFVEASAKGFDLALDDGDGSGAAGGNASSAMRKSMTPAPGLPVSISGLLATRSGLLVGTNLGTLCFYEKTDDMYLYKRQGEFGLDAFPVRHMVLSESNDNAAVVLENCQFYGFSVGELAFVSNSQQAGGGTGKGASSSGDEGAHASPIQRINAPMHHGPVQGVATCIRKPLLATCAADCSVRVWNYLDMSLEVRATFDSDPRAVALHPSGLYLAVAFSDTVRVLSILIDSLRPFWETPMNSCRALAYAHGGQYLAVSQGPNVVVINAWSCKTAFYLQGSSTVPVRGLAWSWDDMRLLAWNVEGTVASWRLAGLTATSDTELPTPVREWEVALRQPGVSAADYVRHDNGHALIVTGHGHLVEVDTDGVARKVVTTRQHHFCQVSTTRSGKRLVAATQSGGLRVLAYPLPAPDPTLTISTTLAESLLNNGAEGDQQPHPVPIVAVAAHPAEAGKTAAAAAAPSGSPAAALRIGEREEAVTVTSPSDAFDIRLHSNAITCLRFSYDETHLFACGLDGCVTVYETAWAEKPKESTFSDEQLAALSDLNQHALRVKQLKVRIDEIKLENAQKLAAQDLANQAKMFETDSKFTAQRQELSEQMAQISFEVESSRTAAANEVAQRSSQSKTECDMLVAMYESKVQAEAEKMQQLQDSTARMDAQYKEQNAAMREAHREGLEQQRHDGETALARKQAEIQRVRERLAQQTVEHQQFLEALEEQLQLEMAEIRSEQETLLNGERANTVQIGSEKQGIKETYDRLSKQLDATKAELNKYVQEEKRLTHIIQSLERDKFGVQQELQEHEETIRDKDLAIVDLRKKDQELEKFKFVLDYKMKKLKKQVEPREQDVRTLIAQIEDMAKELGDYHTTNANLELQLRDQRHKASTLDHEVVRSRATTEDAQQAYRRMVATFASAYEEFGRSSAEPFKAKARIVSVVHKYCGVPGAHDSPGDAPARSLDDSDDAPGAQGADDDDATQELRHWHHLERSIRTLTHKSEQETALRANSIARLMREHATLLAEMNALQRETRVKATRRAANGSGSLGDVSGEAMQHRQVRETVEGRLPV